MRPCALWDSVAGARQATLVPTMGPSAAILVIGSGSADDRSALAGARPGVFVVESAARLAGGLERLRGGGISAVLLDGPEFDRERDAAFGRIWALAPYVPILVIGVEADATASMHDAGRGPTEYLSRDRRDGNTLSRALTRIIERQAVDEALFFEQQRAQVTLSSIGDAVLTTDLPGRVTYLNPVAERMTGWSRHDATGRPLHDVFRIIDARTRRTARDPMTQAVQLDRTVSLTPNCLLVRRDGLETAIEDSASPIHDRRGQVIGAVIVFKDVGEARAMSEQNVHLAHHDSLTDLPNRLLLSDRLSQAMAMAQRQGHRLAVMFLDLDRFKHVNDSLGHLVGDMLLRSVAHRLVGCVRASDTVSRQGGDEFVVLLSQIEHADDAAASARKIIAALVAPHDIANHQLHVSVTIGIGIYPDDGADAEALIRCADTAMYHAKERGRNGFRFFERDMHARAVERQRIEAGLRRALERREFVLHYQAKVALDTGATTGAEALLRWVHPERGLMYPKDFVAIAEDCGLIVPIGRWVMREACRQARAWIDAGRAPFPLAVNVSATEFSDRRFLDGLRVALSDSGLDGSHLELELTERSLIEPGESTALLLTSLKNMGVQVAIDDFGTGYSCLSYLRQFPISVLKIDQSFVHEIHRAPVGTSLACAVISMGRSLGLRVIAEGVETAEQHAFLKNEGCLEGQGYYFSRPLPASEFARLH